MKKIISILVTLSMLITSFGIMTASAVDIVGNKVFELDLSGEAPTDATGNVSNVVLNNGTIMTDAESGVKYIRFDGTARNYLGIPSSSASNAIINNTGTTVEFWYRAADGLEVNRYMKPFGIIPLNDNLGAGDASWYMELWNEGNGKEYFSLHSKWKTKIVQSHLADTKFVPNDWNHFMFVRTFDKDDKTQAVYRTYLNGKLVDSGIGNNVDNYGCNGAGNAKGLVHSHRRATEPDATDAYYLFGSLTTSPNEQVKGDLAGVKIYNTALDLLDAPQKFTDTVDIYRPNSILDNHKIIDVDVTNTDGAASFAETTGNSNLRWSVLPAAGTVEKIDGTKKDYLEFDGTEKYIGAGYGEGSHHAILHKSLTAETWINVDILKNGEYPYIFHISRDNETRLGIELSYKHDYILVKDYHNLKIIHKQGVKSLLESGWVHLALTKDYNSSTSVATYTLYANGAVIGTGTSTGGIPVNSNSIMIGNSYYNNNNDFAGKFGDFRMYDTALSAQQIASRYNADKNLYSDGGFSVKIDEYTGGNTLNTTAGPLAFWGGNPVEKGTEKNVSGGTIDYIGFRPSVAEEFFIADDGHAAAKNHIFNQKKLSVEMWVRVDDILKNNTTNFASIFSTLILPTSKIGAENTWSLVVKDGKLMHSASIKNWEWGINDRGGSVDLTDYEGRYVHVVITRDINFAAKTGTFKTYFNGNLAAQQTYSLDAYTAATPDGTFNKVISNITQYGVWVLGDHYYAHDNQKGLNGRIAEFTVYQNVMADAVAKNIYEAEKDKYEINKPVEITGTTYYNVNEVEINDLNAVVDKTLYAEVSVKNTDSANPQKIFAAAAIYNGNKLVAIEIGETNTVNPGSTSYIEMTFEGTADVSYGSTLKIFVWSDEEGRAMIPCEISGDNVVTELSYTETTQEGA